MPSTNALNVHVFRKASSISGKRAGAVGNSLVAVIGHWQSGEGAPGDDADEVAWLSRAEIIEP